MNMTDPVADMLTRMRNAGMARHQNVVIPMSKLKLAIANILKQEGYIKDFDIPADSANRYFRIWLSYDNNKKPVMTGIKRVSKPGLRVYTNRDEIPVVRGGLGVAILSTSQGVMSGHDAWRKRLGGEVLCYIW